MMIPAHNRKGPNPNCNPRILAMADLCDGRQPLYDITREIVHQLYV